MIRPGHRRCTPCTCCWRSLSQSSPSCSSGWCRGRGGQGTAPCRPRLQSCSSSTAQSFLRTRTSSASSRPWRRPSRTTSPPPPSPASTSSSTTSRRRTRSCPPSRTRHRQSTKKSLHRWPRCARNSRSSKRRQRKNCQRRPRPTRRRAPRWRPRWRALQSRLRSCRRGVWVRLTRASRLPSQPPTLNPSRSRSSKRQSRLPPGLLLGATLRLLEAVAGGSLLQTLPR
mmetsp:Transcript_35783/g.70104  ORF Transcript_35783/g.70104 Transcript_35783/m.70104 type:complete len:227 (+) Transcript_35783:440-1120(+)